jgi:hypothetical protein
LPLAEKYVLGWQLAMWTVFWQECLNSFVKFEDITGIGEMNLNQCGNGFEKLIDRVLLSKGSNNEFPPEFQSEEYFVALNLHFLLLFSCSESTSIVTKSSQSWILLRTFSSPIDYL